MTSFIMLQFINDIILRKSFFVMTFGDDCWIFLNLIFVNGLLQIKSQFFATLKAAFNVLRYTTYSALCDRLQLPAAALLARIPGV